MALGTYAADSYGLLLCWGVARDDSWSWTIGGTIYASTAGGLTQTAPTAANSIIQIVGKAKTATTMFFTPILSTTEILLDAVAFTETAQNIDPANLVAQPVRYYGDNASDQTSTLLPLTTADIGKSFTIVKTGTGAGKSIIQLPAGTYAYDSGHASGAAGTVYLAASARGSMTWVVTSATEIQIVGAPDGSITFT